MHLHLEPSSVEVKKLAKEWVNLYESAYKDFPTELKEKMWKANKSGIYPKDQMPYFRQDVVDFIDAAIEHHKIRTL
ncbi:MAG: hypothetical protein CMF48_05015 [Legionellales bacterium]|nr:hypothetical protein [Legionellales bacterium]|tara:strand:+ start:2351 stop:2578 length:228 start_codon:yes stop_codon:yes gene_type:complete